MEFMKPYLPLDHQVILEKLPKIFQNQFEFYQYESIDSTNQFLKDLTTSSHKIQCCIAEMQTAGRGRFGRAWFSPLGENIYFSLKVNLGQTNLSGLSLTMSLAVIATLKQFIHLQPLVKWPNDILINQKKCCGILLEAVQDAIIIGIGINVNSELPKESPDPRKPWCSLFQVTGQRFNRNDIIGQLIVEILHYIEVFKQRGFAYFIQEWNSVDFLYNKVISVKNFNQEITGVAKGINEFGQLMLKDSQEEMHQLTSGDTSLLTFL